MGTTSLKVFFVVALTFTVLYIKSYAIADHPFGNFPMCRFFSDRLPLTEVVPIKYDLDIRISLMSKKLYNYVNITIDIMKSTRNITLSGRSLNIINDQTKIMIFDKLSKSYQNGSFKLLGTRYCTKINILILIFDKIIHPGPYLLHIVYTSLLNKDAHEVFYPFYPIGEKEEWMLTNLYTPHSLQTVFPYWDDPTVKAPFNIRIVHMLNSTVLSNMMIQNTVQYQQFFKITDFFETLSMPTYLLGFILMENTTRYAERRDIHYIYHKHNISRIFKYIINTADKTTTYFSKHMKIDMKRIFPKIDHVVFANSPMKSMSRPGLAVYREKNIAFDYDSDYSGRFIDVATLITYEMSRQILAGLVSRHLNITDIWINEILASFFSYYIVNETMRIDRLMELFVVKNILPALDSDIVLEREPIMRKAKTSEEIDALLYSALYHKKAFALIRMLFNIFTPKTFKEAMSKYAQTRTKDAWTVMEEVYPLKEKFKYTVKEIMESWFEAKHHPKIIVERDLETKTAYCVVLYLKFGVNWKIPISYITKTSVSLGYNVSNVNVFNFEEAVFVIKDINPSDFIIVNTELLGYYRVNYDELNWNLISTYLHSKNFSLIPAINRAQLINDAYYFTVRKELSISIFFGLIKYLEKETDFIACYPLFNIFSYMSIYFELPESENVRNTFTEILTDMLYTLGYMESKYENEQQRLLRILALKWLCKFGHQGCEVLANDRLKTYIADDTLDSIPSIWKEWVFCAGLRIASEETWDKVLNESIKRNNTEFLKYLSCSEIIPVIKHYLTLMLESNDLSQLNQPLGPIYRTVIKKHIKKDEVLRFLLNNYDKISRRFPDDFSADTLITYMTVNVHSTEQLDLIRQFAINISQSSVFNKSIDQWKKYSTKVLNNFEVFHVEVKTS